MKMTLKRKFIFVMYVESVLEEKGLLKGTRKFIQIINFTNVNSAKSPILVLVH
ncbi:unnamed protein product [Larinioides sclopetarius]|uniref:Uncharacterized protein n=1 Tax=Larinioides sclopetarius TaxID=280406 RepID=A0AAV2ABP5_9ARAC